MAINERKLVDGTIRYEARMNCRNTKNRCVRFDTREEAEERLALWAKDKPVKIVKKDITALQNKFLLGK